MTAQIHGYQCLRCTLSTIKKISAKDSCCTAVRDGKKYGLDRCKVGERLPSMCPIEAASMPVSG